MKVTWLKWKLESFHAFKLQKNSLRHFTFKISLLSDEIFKHSPTNNVEIERISLLLEKQAFTGGKEKNHFKALSFFPIDNLFFNLLNPIFFSHSIMNSFANKYTPTCCKIDNKLWMERVATYTVCSWREPDGVLKIDAWRNHYPKCLSSHCQSYPFSRLKLIDSNFKWVFFVAENFLHREKKGRERLIEKKNLRLWNVMHHFPQALRSSSFWSRNMKKKLFLYPDLRFEEERKERKREMLCR